MSPPVIAFRQAACRVDGRLVLGPLSLDVTAGEVVVLLGRSGAGKTTALRMINGLVLPTSGEVEVNGRSTRVWDAVRLRRGIGYVIQEIGLFPHMTVERNVGLVPRLERWPVARIQARVHELLSLVGLPPQDFARRLPHQLSGGQRQRVGVARALAADPPILLCDEPFGAVDPLARAELQGEFKALTARLGRTVVFVTHDVREALTLATRIVVLEHGQVHFSGSPREFQESQDPHVRALGESA
ncbi:MAG TPA: ATP-binding cassette domain-containing protein [Gemmatimonadales bacterium]|nr:ATP-binding cassette domain-containing protein [Gemmatimonadales bacterium]